MAKFCAEKNVLKLLKRDYLGIIIWLVFVGDITRALIGLLSLNCRVLFFRNAHGLITGVACKKRAKGN